MKKFINHVDDFLVESLAGFGAAHSDLVVLNQEPVFVRRKTLKPGKVALISAAGRDTSRCTSASSATACWTPRVRARSSRRQHPTR